MPWLCDPLPPEVVAGELDKVPAQSLQATAYWQRLRPRLSSFGISRVADITGLDRVGLPVAQAVRPGARSNAVTQGKGASLEAAAVGAVLECLEMAAGENLERFATIPKGRGPDWSPLAPGLSDGVVWPDADTPYIAGYDLLRGTVAAVPRDLISTDFTRDAPSSKAPILRHSIGFGAGTNLGSAMMHGVLEYIEADARLRAEAQSSAQRIALAPDNPDYGPLLAQLEAAGLRAAVFDLPCKGGIIAVKASVMERPSADALPLPAEGFAARPHYSDAIAAALNEAVQARLAVISGAREDITQRFYVHGFPLDALQAEWARHGPAISMIVDQPQKPQPSLRALAAEVGPVFAVPLHWDPDLPLAITRIVAPALIADPQRLVPA